MAQGVMVQRGKGWVHRPEDSSADLVHYPPSRAPASSLEENQRVEFVGEGQKGPGAGGPCALTIQVDSRRGPHRDRGGGLASFRSPTVGSGP